MIHLQHSTNGTVLPIAKPMEPFKQGDVVRVPFHYTDKNTRQHRPALVISSIPIGENGALLWVAMITSAEHRSWPGDVAIKRFQHVGLPAPSVVRTAKVATIETRHAERIGILDKPTMTAAIRHFRQNLLGTSPAI